ncbi:MAG: ParB/RepB/Spo0J family partition protein [bacterium]|nr:ParB/RepB/Spo0J family partition protein [bacterium]
MDEVEQQQQPVADSELSATDAEGGGWKAGGANDSMSVAEGHKFEKSGIDAVPETHTVSQLLPHNPLGVPHPSEKGEGRETTPLAPPSRGTLPVHQTAIFHIEVDKIIPNRHQPRRYFDEEALRELAVSIREFGVLQPLVVSKIEEETEAGTNVIYELIAGERRLLASKMAGLERVPAIVRNISYDRERLELAVIENLQREDLDPIETARAYSKLQDEFRLTQREIAARIGKSREAVANSVRLLQLPSEVQDALSRRMISESQGRLLLSVLDIAEQRAIFENLLKNAMTVRELKSHIDRRRVARAAPPAGGPDPEAEALKERLEVFLGAPVSVEKNGESGKITISFYSGEELNSIIEKLTSPEQE